MDALNKARARDARKFSQTILDPIVVNNVQDIKRVVAGLDPKKNPVSHDIEIAAQMRGLDTEDKMQTYEVRANTKSRTKRDMLVDGMNVIKRRVDISDKLQSDDTVEIDGTNMRTIKLHSGTEGRNWVDPLINQWTGGFRVGIHICWDLDGYRYKYDIFEHKLTRIPNALRSPTTSTI